MTGFNDKPTLSFNRVRLEPLTLQHEDGLREAVCDGRLWELAVTSAPAPDQVAAYIQTASATRTAFAVIDERSGKVVGSTSLYHIDEAVPRVEIGFTWYAQSVQRTHVNTSCQLMLLHRYSEHGVATRHRTAGRAKRRHPAPPPNPQRRQRARYGDVQYAARRVAGGAGGLAQAAGTGGGSPINKGRLNISDGLCFYNRL